jgi:hypothetical protein
MKRQKRLDPRNPPTIDEVVAHNLRKLREGLGLSRARLAKQLNATGGGGWSTWRIIDLEGARSPDRPPRPITWPEIVALSFTLDVTMFEIVLPSDIESAVNISSRVWDVPTDRPPKDGKESPQTYRHSMGTDLFSMTLFRLPAELLASDKLEESGERFNYQQSADEIARDLAKITEQVDDLAQRAKELDYPSEDT